VAGEEDGEAERRGGSGSASAVLLSIAICGRDSEWRGNGEGIRGRLEDSMGLMEAHVFIRRLKSRGVWGLNGR
jgi:hypothetical protein